ncbi:hypothetical protein KGF56_000616 [Candida oxycetoniae]|uniref:AB hydrolase-1 domain-containing protein n=1 Tax=Candida oxycetoniae TaxID=497107 RepID=A0AAI9T0R4_9ASCO|nr:uncharacterized protein KGF56_000616 [Candida oxycetoniae]KAI3406484.2 hypothetical protein KGF56_000616 [Candida oxycetoniae]
MSVSSTSESTHTQESTSVAHKKKVNEFQDGRKRPEYSWKQSWADWFKQSWSSEYNDLKVEHRLLSQLSFYPKPTLATDKRRGEIINTDIGNGQYIHEFYIENNELADTDTNTNNSNNNNNAVSILPNTCKEIVLIHGYAASLGLFIDNFDSLSSIPGIKIHAIDLLGFGMSSRPKFPHLPSSTKQDIYKVEDWFIDSLEVWRKKRGIENFVLMGHSFGGYLSCAYAMKYNKPKSKNETTTTTQKSSSLIDKLVLISPVGVERNKFSLLDNQTTIPQISIEQEILADQEDIVHGSQSDSTTIATSTIEEEKGAEKGVQVGAGGRGGRTAAAAAAATTTTTAEAVEEEKSQTSRQKRLFNYLWQHNFSPFFLIRNAGPLKSKWISQWTTHRFAHTYYQNQESFQNMHDYIYRVFNGYGSGEYAITRVLAVGALAKLPLLDRCPQKFVDMKLPTLWLYGDKDWMNEKAGEEITDEINKLSMQQYSKRLAEFAIVKNAGHHLYLDNPPDFAKIVFNFLGFVEKK